MESWIHITPISGNGDNTVSITIDANNSSEDRTAEISVATSTLNKILNITQKGTQMYSKFLTGLGFVVMNDTSNSLLPDRYNLQDETTEVFTFTGGCTSGTKIVGSILIKTEVLNRTSFYIEKISGKNFKVQTKEIGDYTYMVGSVETDGCAAGIDFNYIDENDMTYHTIVEYTPR